MKNLSKIIEIILPGVMLFSLTGCGNTVENISEEIVVDNVIEENNELENLEEVNATENYFSSEKLNNYQIVQVISLPSNPTTGYNWSYEIEDDSIAVVESDEYTMNDAKEGIVGVGGTMTYRISGLKEGKTTFTFKYWREFEGPESVIETVVYEVAVDSDNKIAILSENSLKN